MIPVDYGDWMDARAPSFHEARSLELSQGEGVWDIWRADGIREVFRTSLVAIVPRGIVIDVFDKHRRVTSYMGQTCILIKDEFGTPDHSTPRWRQVYRDIVGEIQQRWLRPGDRIPSVEILATMFGYSRTSAVKALRHLQANGWVESHRAGTFVLPRRTKPVWHQIYKDLRAEILIRRLRPGAEIPSLDRLTHMYQCSPAVARAALRQLRVDELVEGRRGLGYFVADPRTRLYRRGERVALVYTGDRYTCLRPGDEGTTTRHDRSKGVVDVEWDSGSTLTILWHAGDRIRRVERNSHR